MKVTRRNPERRVGIVPTPATAADAAEIEA